MEISVHDNQIIAYSVNSQKNEIHFQTIYGDELTDVIFSGVKIYHFECDNFNSIIFDIYETSLEETYSENELIFSKLKNYSWITDNYEDKKDLIRKMEKLDIKSFVIHSSYGLSGWIWAKDMIKKQREVI